jgi:hypothetical protein
MNLSYDSVLGIPTLDASVNKRQNTQNMGLNLGVPSLIIFIIILILFIAIFVNLGTNGNSMTTETSTSDGSTNVLSIILGGVLIVVLLLNISQYFFNINLTAQLSNLFTNTPSLDITVEPTTPSLSPVPEITLKEQVYHIPGNTYTYDDAKALCQAYGARLASYNEIENSYNNGGEWCSYGWSDKQMALFPTQKKTWDYLQTVEGHENDCGRPGINGGYIANPNVRFGVNCYGYKPEITDLEKELMATEPLYPRSLKDIKQEKRVEYWRRKIPEILVSPFNKNVWSLI